MKLIDFINKHVNGIENSVKIYIWNVTQDEPLAMLTSLDELNDRRDLYDLQIDEFGSINIAHSHVTFWVH